MSFPNGPGNTLVLGTVACCVKTLPDGSYNIKEMQDESGPEAHVEFEMAWGDRYTFVQNVLGMSVGVAGTVVRIPPVRYPPSPNLLAVAVTDIHGISPAADSGGFPAHTLASVTVVFRRPAYSIPGDVIWDESGHYYTITRTRSSGEAFTPPNGAFFYESTGAQVEEAAIGVLRGRIEISLTRVLMPPGIMLPIVAAAQNTVNSTAVTIGNYTFPEGYLLFASADKELAADAGGNVTENVTCTLLGNTDHAWNQYKLPDSGSGWDYINTKSDGTGSRVFTETNFWSTLWPDGM